MYLLDTNVWLERLLNQERSAEVIRFLERTPLDEVRLTDFCLHSITLILIREHRSNMLLQFVRDLLLDGDAEVVRLYPEEFRHILDAQARFRLDFDDAYQYVAAERRDLVLVSFDSDFDRTECGRQTPVAILAERTTER